jgi:excisionase family DNA binding protein
MIDTTEVATEIQRMITAGTTDRELLAVMTRRFPNLTLADLSRALQEAVAAIARQASAPKGNDRPFSVKMLAERWGCSRQFIHTLVRKGDLKVFRLGEKLTRIPAEEVRRVGRSRAWCSLRPVTRHQRSRSGHGRPRTSLSIP